MQQVINYAIFCLVGLFVNDALLMAVYNYKHNI